MTLRPALVLGLFSLLLAACAAPDRSREYGTISARPGEPLLIGVSVALTGDSSGDAQAIERGVRLAVEQAPPLKGHTLDVRVLDDGCSAERSIAAAQAFAAMPDLIGVIGPMCSRGCLPASLVFDEAKLLMVTPTCTAASLTGQGLPTIFRVVWNGELPMIGGAKFAAGQLKAKRIFAITDGTFYGKTQRDRFKVILEDRGGDLIADEQVRADEWDFTTLVQQVQAAQPDLVFFGGFLPAATFLIQQLRYNGVRAPFLGGDALLDEERFIAAANSAAEGAYLTDARPHEGKRYPDFARRYHARWSSEPAAAAAYAYDAARALLEAAAEVAESRQATVSIDKRALRNEIFRTDFQGATGRLRFFRNGDRVAGAIAVIKQVRNGRFEVVKEYEVEE